MGTITMACHTTTEIQEETRPCLVSSCASRRWNAARSCLRQDDGERVGRAPSMAEVLSLRPRMTKGVAQDDVGVAQEDDGGGPG